MLIKLAALGALGFAGYRYFEKRRGGENFSQVRGAGPEAMQDGNADTWDSIDQESDESFPASDPPANY